MMVKSFNISIRDEPLVNSIPDDDLNEFFKIYDASDFEIGMFRFINIPVLKGKAWHIGYLEEDPVFLDEYGITVRDGSSINHVMYKCAKNGSCLLSSLNESSSYLNLCMIADYHQTAREKDFLDLVVELSGSDDSIQFYRTLLGVF
jgi:hypothetical protein